MNPITVRFMLAGAVIIVAGVAIAIIGTGVGEGAVWKGTAVAIAGAGFVVSGILRHMRGPSE